MADFLTGILNRAMARTPILERRRPSLFEPAAGTVQAEPQWQAPERVQEMDVESAPPSVRAPEERTASMARPVPVSPPRMPVPWEPEKRAMVTPEHRAPVRPAARHVEFPEPEAPAPVPAAIVRTRVPEPLQTTVVTEAPTLRVERREEERVERVLARRRVISEEAIESHAPAPARSAAARPADVPRRPASVAPPRPAAIRIHAVAPPQPTIEVTIGRIEVRANAASAPRPVPRPSRPKLNLEDYLRTRAGGAQ